MTVGGNFRGSGTSAVDLAGSCSIVAVRIVAFGSRLHSVSIKVFFLEYILGGETVLHFLATGSEHFIYFVAATFIWVKSM